MTIVQDLKKMVLANIWSEMQEMTTEKFEEELRKIQETLEQTEEQIEDMLNMQRRVQKGEIKLPPFKDW